MTLIDAERAEALYAADGAGDREFGRLGRQHDGRHRLARRHAAAISARCATICWAASSATTSAPRRALRHRPPRPGRRTARCLILVTAGRRSARWRPISAPASSSAPTIIDATLIAAAQVTYLEGYLFDPPRAKEAFRAAAAIAHDGRAAGGALAVRPVLRRAPPRRVPRPGRGPCRHPVRQRGRDLLAVRDRRFRRRRCAGARPCARSRR